MFNSSKNTLFGDVRTEKGKEAACCDTKYFKKSLLSEAIDLFSVKTACCENSEEGSGSGS